MHTSVLGIDPGPKESAWLWLQDGRPRRFAKETNERLLVRLPDMRHTKIMAIEGMQSFGMAVGRSVFETCYWVGRFVQAWGAQYDILHRLQVKVHICKSPRATDSNIRRALIDRYGGDDAIGRKHKPGPLYGIHGDVWSALAIAVTWYDHQGVPKPPHSRDCT